MIKDYSNPDNSGAQTRKDFEDKYGQVWDTQELQYDYRVVGFGAPYVVVESKKDNKSGTLEFNHSPRFYFNWKEKQ